MSSIYKQLLGYLKNGERIQVGSLLSTVGSAPQIPGALAIFKNENVVAGTLGGGLLEANAQKQAALSAKEMQNAMQWVHFNAEMQDEIGAICGGSALYLMDANPITHIAVYEEIATSLHMHRGGSLMTFIKRPVVGNVEIEKHWIEAQGSISPEIGSMLKNNNIDILAILNARTPKYFATLVKEDQIPESVSLFIEPIHPTPRLIIAGAGHIGQALCHLSAMVDFEPIILDNRPSLASHERFPDAAQIICKPFSEVFNEIHISKDTYIVIATQGHRTDKEVLKACICSEAAYIGLIGSKRKTMLMGQNLIEEKACTSDEWNFIHTPIGVDIHSKTVNEIAVSVLAELIKERYEINFINRKKKIVSIVLAAGKSTRMGTQKLLLPFRGTSILKSIIEEITHSNSQETWVVIGSHKNEITENLKDCKLNLVENENFEEGMLSSVLTGVNAANKNCDGFLIFLGDQPLIPHAIINRLITVFQKTKKGLLVPTFSGKRGHPVLIDSKYAEAINQINPNIGLRELFINNPSDILEIEVENEAILKDIDTPEDYSEVFEQKN